MDGRNAYNAWGLSPAVDLLCLLPKANYERISILQAAACDPRHTLLTICNAERHSLSQCTGVDLFVFEDSAEALARHILLISIFLDVKLPPLKRIQVFLEVFGNSMLREDTAAYMEAQLQHLEGLCDGCCAEISSLFDLSALKHVERDAIVAAFRMMRKHIKAFDMPRAWDHRCRAWLADRYDFRRNMVDWDYHMRLVPGLEGKDSHACIIHPYHYRHWRLTGLAFELRSCTYVAANSTLLSTMEGRRKDFVNRDGEYVGGSVEATGLWCDTLCSPYHSFGTSCEDEKYFQKSNNEFKYTAVDISERNVLAMLHELRTGKPWEGTEGKMHRSALARGPTDMQDLFEASRPAKDTDAAPVGKAEAEAISEQEAVLDREAARRCTRFKIHLLMGRFTKAVSGRARYKNTFHAAFIGVHHAHILGPSHGLAGIISPGGTVVAEKANYMLALKSEQVVAINGKLRDLACEAGFQDAEQAFLPGPFLNLQARSMRENESPNADHEHELMA